MKDEFLATVGHELRTPLNAMLGWIHILRQQDETLGSNRPGADDRSRRTRAFDTVERNARAQSQLIDDLLDVSRIVAGKLTLQRPAGRARRPRRGRDRRDAAGGRGEAHQDPVGARLDRDDPRRHAAPAAGGGEPAVERDQVHAQGRAGPDLRRAPRFVGRSHRRGQRPGHPAGVPAARLRALPPGRQHRGAQDVRPRPRPRHRPPHRRTARRHGRRSKAKARATARPSRCGCRCRWRRGATSRRPTRVNANCIVRRRWRTCASSSSTTSRIRARCCERCWKNARRRSRRRLRPTRSRSSPLGSRTSSSPTSACPRSTGTAFIEELRRRSRRPRAARIPAVALTAHARVEDRARALYVGLQQPRAQAGRAAGALCRPQRAGDPRRALA